jgi:hypothetical protein
VQIDAPANLYYDISEYGFSKFEAFVGVDAEKYDMGDVVFRVYGDFGDGEYVELYSSNPSGPGANELTPPFCQALRPLHFLAAQLASLTPRPFPPLGTPRYPSLFPQALFLAGLASIHQLGRSAELQPQLEPSAFQ